MKRIVLAILIAVYGVSPASAMPLFEASKLPVVSEAAPVKVRSLKRKANRQARRQMRAERRSERKAMREQRRANRKARLLKRKARIEAKLNNL